MESMSPAILTADSLKLIKDINASTQRLVDKLTAFSTMDFNTKPNPVSWSAGDVAEHILKVEIGVNNVLRGPVQHTGRPEDEHLEWMQSAFSNKERRMNAPDFSFPTETKKDLWEMINQITWQRDKLKEIITTATLSDACIGYKHYYFGELTIYEWVQFVLLHCERHLWQLDNIHNAIG